MNAADVSRCQFSPREPTRSRERDRDDAVLPRAAEEDVGDQQVVPHPEELEDRERGERRDRQRDHEPPEDREVVGTVDLGGLDDRGRQGADVVAEQVHGQRQPEARVCQPHPQEGAAGGRGRGRSAVRTGSTPRVYSRRIGISAICNGTTSSPTTITNRTYRPWNSIQANAYAANAAIVIGITVEGIVTARLFRNAFPNPPASSARR